MEMNSALQIDIAGNRYHIDGTQEHLIPVDQSLTVIKTGALEIAMDHDWERSGYYDLINRRLYDPPEQLLALPENVIGFAIPSYQAISEQLHTSLIVYAETAALKDTSLAVTVEENKIRKLDQRRYKEIARPETVKRKTGRGI